MPETRILAIDPGSHCGWAQLEPAGLFSGTVHFTDDDYGWRFAHFHGWLKTRLSCDEWLIVWEAQHHRGAAATQLGLGFQAILQMVAARYEHRRMTCHTGTLKKWATGSGKAGKPEMMAAAARLTGRVPADDNEGDALCLLAWAGAHIETEGADE